MSAALSIFGHDVDAVIFDCDGVLVDTEYTKFLAWQHALAQKGIDFSIEEYRPCVGNSSKNILAMLSRTKGFDIPVEVIALKNAEYQRLHEQGVTAIPEVIAYASQLIREKSCLGIKVGVASSAPRNEILHNLREIGLENAFDVVLSGSTDLVSYVDPEGCNKPKPYIYLEMAKQLNIPADRCLVFEDTEAGIVSATTAGMIAIAVPNSFTSEQDFSQAAHVVHGYDELLLGSGM